jgi:hypothetical protein
VKLIWASERNFTFLPAIGKKKTEERGFEPLVPFGTTVFKTATISHSVTPPSFNLWLIYR